MIVRIRKKVKSWLNQGGCAAFSYSGCPEVSDEAAMQRTIERLDEFKLKHLIVVGGPADINWAYVLSERLKEMNKKINVKS